MIEGNSWALRAHEFWYIGRKNMKKTTIAFLCLSVVLLCACSHERQQESKSNSLSSGAEAYPSPWSLQELTLCSKETTTGFYSIESVWPGSFNVFYLDYAAGQQLFLCNVPNCTHNDDTCTSYIPLMEDEMPPMVLTVNDKILFVKHAATAERPAGLQIADANGKNRHQLLELPADKTLGGMIFTDGNNLYCEMLGIKEENGAPIQVDTVIKIELESGKYSEFIVLPPNQVLYGAVGGCLVVEEGDWNPNSQKAFRSFYYLHLPTAEEEAYVESKPFYTFNPEECGAYVANNTVYTLSYDNYIFSAKDLRTNQEKSIDCSFFVPPYDGEHRTSVSNFQGGYFLLETYEPKENGGSPITLRLIDLENNRISDTLELRTKQEGITIVPITTYQEKFYIIYDYEHKQVVFSNNNEMETLDLWLPLYATIRCEDYFNSVENFVPIQPIMLN